MKIKIITLEQSIGFPLSHDLTLIDPARGFKGARFKRGHKVEREDIPILRRMGREHLSILELDQDEVHEDEAALRLAEIFSQNTRFSVTAPSEGRCNLIAREKGLFVLDSKFINEINSDPEWVMSTIANYSRVDAGSVVAAWRIAPLVITEDRVARAETFARQCAFDVAPFCPLKTALVTTGAEIARGDVEDVFIKKLPSKLEIYDAPLVEHVKISDDREKLSSLLLEICKRAEVVICTGGMSVDADDITPLAIADVCDEIIFKGLPMLPGSNLMLGRRKDVFILGVPACAVHANVTALDVVMDRLYSKKIPTREETRAWGTGGLCRGCKVCNFPTCSFGNRL